MKNGQNMNFYSLKLAKMRSTDKLTKRVIAQRGARTHDPEIKSLMLYRLS